MQVYAILLGNIGGFQIFPQKNLISRGKYTALKSKTCVLIAINSFLEVLHQSGQFVFFYITATGIDFIPALLAFEIEGYYVISTYVVTFMFLTMSIDKVLAVAFPLL